MASESASGGGWSVIYLFSFSKEKGRPPQQWPAEGQRSVNHFYSFMGTSPQNPALATLEQGWPPDSWLNAAKQCADRVLGDFERNECQD
jgi:hypothetical protein